MTNPRIIKVSDYTDIQLVCIDCGTAFTFSAGEQAFFASKGFTTQPKRCPDCRKFRRLSLVLDDRPTPTQQLSRINAAFDRANGKGGCDDNHS